MSCPTRCDRLNLDLAAGLNQYRFADAGRQRQRPLELANQRQHHQKMQEIIRGTESAQEQPCPLRRFSAISSWRVLILRRSVIYDFFPQDFMHIWYSVLQVGPA